MSTTLLERLRWWSGAPELQRYRGHAFDCGLAADLLEDVLEWLETGKVDGVSFDQASIVDTLRELIK